MDALFQEGRERPCHPRSLSGIREWILGASQRGRAPVLTGEDLHATVLAKRSSSGGLDGWGWNELKALLLS